MIIAFLVGAIGGFLAAIPPGPLSITIFTEAVRQQTKRAFLVAAGGMIFEGVYACAGFFGVHALYSPSIDLIVRAISSMLLIVMGILYIRSKEDPTIKIQTDVSPKHSLIVLGAILTGTTPTIMGGYLVMASIARVYNLFESSSLNNVTAALGAVAGSMCWIFLIVEMITRFKDRIKQGVLLKIVRITGISLVILGVWIGGQLLLMIL